MTFQLNSKIKRMNSNKAKLIRQCFAILGISKNRIIKQGSGCVIPNTGAAYKYKYNRDSIAILLNFSQIKNSTYGEISDDSQRYLIKLIAQKFSVNIESYNNYSYFVNFLQMLQDAHDNAFDPYVNQLDDRMSFFTSECDKISDILLSDLKKVIE